MRSMIFVIQMALMLGPFRELSCKWMMTAGPEAIRHLVWVQYWATYDDTVVFFLPHGQRY